MKKLLSPQELKNIKDIELSRDIQRTTATKKELEKTVVELNDLEARFEATLTRQKVVWVKEEEEAHKRLDEVNKEIQLQKEQLIPIEAKLERANNLSIKANLLYKDNEYRKQELEELTERLEERIDSYSEKDTELLKREEALKLKELSIEEQRLMLEKLQKELQIKWQEFYKQNG